MNSFITDCIGVPQGFCADMIWKLKLDCGVDADPVF